MSKVWNVRADYTVIAASEEEVWEKWASGEDVTYDGVWSIDFMHEEEYEDE